MPRIRRGRSSRGRAPAARLTCARGVRAGAPRLRRGSGGPAPMRRSADRLDHQMGSRYGRGMDKLQLRGRHARHLAPRAGFACGQAVLAAFAERHGVGRDAALRAACGFGGGIARTGGLCGAVSGGIVAVGLAHGRTRLEDGQAVERTSEATRALLAEFRRENGSATCRELLRLRHRHAGGPRRGEGRRPASLALSRPRPTPPASSRRSSEAAARGLRDRRERRIRRCRPRPHAEAYVHGYRSARANACSTRRRRWPSCCTPTRATRAGSAVLEAGCGVGAQTVSLARNSPGARFTCVDVSAESLAAGAGESARGLARQRRLPAGRPLPAAVPGGQLRSRVRVLRARAPLAAARGPREPRVAPAAGRNAHGDRRRPRVDVLPPRRRRRAPGDRLPRHAPGPRRRGRPHRPAALPLARPGGLRDVAVSPRMVYVDSSRPGWVEGFTKNTFTAMVEGVREQALAAGSPTRRRGGAASPGCVARRRRTACSATRSSRASG